MKTLGLIGTGNLAGFFVEGLARAKTNYTITVSPRNALKVQELRQKFGVRVASNQEIIDSCQVHVCLSLVGGCRGSPRQPFETPPKEGGSSGRTEKFL